MERELLLLGLLRQMDMHGYRLAEFIERDLTICTDLKKSTAYFLLDKMVKQGWITQHQEQEGNRPLRRVYRITPEGEVQFQQSLRENLSRHTSATFVGDIGLSFVDALAPDEAIALLRQRRAALAEDLAAARVVPKHEGAWQLLIEHRVVHLEAELHWLDEVLARLAGGN
ncbi:MAG: helix-turn-helix transcriptional regulator [Chloroflexi bacterium]|nr:helix-turn-helix transcriptional regulator [Chloroflexota bacterium]